MYIYFIFVNFMWFSAPANYDDLLNLLQEHNEKDQLTIITRLRKCHHVSLAEGNKQKLEVKGNYSV